MKTDEKTKNKISKELIPFFKEAREIAKKATGTEDFGVFHVFKALMNLDSKFQRAIYHAVLLESNMSEKLEKEIVKFKLKKEEDKVSADVKYLAAKFGHDKNTFVSNLIQSTKIEAILKDSYTEMEDFIKFYCEEKVSEKDDPYFGVRSVGVDYNFNQSNPQSSLSTNFLTDLTKEAKDGLLPNVIGREKEIQEIYKILQRKTKSNPVVVGESGVGKTALIYALAQKIAEKDCPKYLQDKVVLELKLSSLMSGTEMQGSLEKKLENMLQDIKKLNGQAIVFIDDLDNIMTTSNSKMPVAQLLKPFLSRSDFPIIGTSTIEKYPLIESDISIARYFQTIKIDQPSVAETIAILRGLRSKFEEHHNITIEDNAIIQAVKMSDRYIMDRHFPDKAIDIIDEAASIVKMSMDSKPLEVLDIENKLKQKRLEKASVVFDGSEDSAIQMNNLNKELLMLEAEEKEVLELLEQDYKLRDKIKQTKQKIDRLESESLDSLDDGEDLSLLKTEFKMLKDMNYSVLVQELTVSEVLKTIAKKSGIPLDKMKESDKEKVLGLANRLNKKLIGQSEAVNAVSRAIKRSAAGLSDPERPIGSFLFLGSSGVGKTELCKQLAFEMFGKKNSIIRLDMSEYMEKHMVTKLIGSPSGYEGSNNGGFLTNEVRKKPYSIVLFDEIEKAHPDVLNILLQILDEGHLTDSKGSTVSFKNTIVVLTSNIGSEFIKKNNNKEKQKVIEELEKKMRPELINRIDEKIVFDALTEENLIEIAKLMVSPIIKQLEEKRISLTIDDKCFAILVKDACDARYGARPLKRKIQSMIDDKISDYLLDGFLGKGSQITLEEMNGRIQLIKSVEYK